MAEVFPFHEPSSYDLRNKKDFLLNPIRKVNYGSKTVSYLGPKIWNLVPTEIKKEESLSAFKRKIKQWVPEDCPCILCKRYIQYVGFI